MLGIHHTITTSICCSNQSVAQKDACCGQATGFVGGCKRVVIDTCDDFHSDFGIHLVIHAGAYIPENMIA